MTASHFKQLASSLFLVKKQGTDIQGTMLLPPPPSPAGTSYPKQFSVGLKVMVLTFSMLVALSLLPSIYLDYFRNASRFVAPNGSLVSAGMDFDARYNEICCVLEGTDPYLIRLHPGLSDTYAHYLTPSSSPPKRRIDAYSPWSYTYFSWLSFLSESIAWIVFYLLMLACLCVLPAFAVICSIHSGKWTAALCAAASLFLGFPITACLYAGNYGLFIAANLCLFVWAMHNGYRLLAAVAFAFMMIKPQTSVLLVISLLIQREFGVCVWAGVFCVLASVVPAFCCHQPVHAMILEILAFGATVATQTKLMPASIMSLLSPIVSMNVLNLSSAVIGLFLCLWLSYRLRHESSWMIRILPAVVLGSFWTYCLPCNDCTLALPQVFFCWVLLQPFPVKLKCPAAICMGTIPLLHIQRSISVENLPWSFLNVLGLSFPDHSLPVRLLSLVHLLAGYLLLASFILFCLRLSRTNLLPSSDSRQLL